MAALKARIRQEQAGSLPSQPDAAQQPTTEQPDTADDVYVGGFVADDENATSQEAPGSMEKTKPTSLSIRDAIAAQQPVQQAKACFGHEDTSAGDRLKLWARIEANSPAGPPAAQQAYMPIPDPNLADVLAVLEGRDWPALTHEPLMVVEQVPLDALRVGGEREAGENPSPEKPVRQPAKAQHREEGSAQRRVSPSTPQPPPTSRAAQGDGFASQMRNGPR
jgi:hypothetical protein